MATRSCFRIALIFNFIAFFSFWTYSDSLAGSRTSVPDEDNWITSTTPALSVSPTVLDYGFTLTSLKFTVKNNGTSTLDWSASENPSESWITIVGATSGSLNAGQSTQVQVNISRTGLYEGPNYGEILVSSNGGDQTLELIVEVGPTPTTPVLYIDPPVLDFNIGLTLLTFKVKNRGVGTLNWQAAENPETSWITSISTTSGSLASMEEIEATVQVSRFSLSDGIYKSLIAVTSNGGNSNIEVEMIVGERPKTIRANVGGASYTDGNNNFWATDRPYHEGAWGHVRGHPYSVTADIKNTQDDALYQNELFWLDAYRFDVSNGNYTVVLHFTELYYSYSSGRVFDVYIENNLVLDNFDIYKQAGFQTATSRTFSGVQVTDGRVDIEFEHIRAHGELVAIELVSEAASPPYIAVNPISLGFNATVGGSNPPSQNITVTNTGGGLLSWMATEQPNQSWITLTNTNGGSGNYVTVSVTISGLSVGAYSGTVRISDPNASNNPVDIPVTLTIDSPSTPLVLELKDHSYAYPGEDWTNAIDGDISGWDGTVTAEGDPPYAIFGFSGGVTKQINKVRLLTDTGVRFSNRWVKEFRIQVSTTGTNEGNFTTVLDAVKNGGAWQEYTFASVAAKYVKFIIDAPASGYRQLGEFEVYSSEGGTTNPVIAVNPTSLSFNGTVSGSNPSSQNVIVTNTGGGTLAWTATEQADQSWMALTNTTGGSGNYVTIAVTIAGLSPGTYNGTVRITDPNASNNPVDVSVKLVIQAQQPPIIAVNPISLGFNATLGGSNPPSQNITVTNTGGGTLAWTATEQPDQSWMTLTNTSGGSVDHVTVSVTIAGLSVGTYNGTVRISDPNASNNPVDVPVTLVVEAPQSGPLVLELIDCSYAYPGEDWTNAIDGDISGWDGTVTAEGNLPWAIFGFSGGATKQINKVRLLTDTGVRFSSRWLKEFRVMVSTTGTNESNFTLILDAVKNGGAWEEYNFATVSAKYIKFVIDAPSSGYRQLGEFEVYNSVSLAENLSHQSEVLGENIFDDKISSSEKTAFSLGQNYPNPFNPTTSIQFQIPEEGMVTIQIFNILGNLVKTLSHENMTPGTHQVQWDGKDETGVQVSNGTYFYQLRFQNFIETRKMTMVR